MFKHYLTTALRHFRQHQFTTALNIACLAFGLMCFLGVYGLVAYLQGGDRHIPHLERTLVLSNRVLVPGSDSVKTTMPTSAWIVAPLLKNDFPQLKGIARLTSVSPWTAGASLKYQAIGMDAKVRFADAEIVDVLSLPLAAGDTNALRAPRSIVVSKSVAQQLFGSANEAVGRAVTLFGSTPLTVTGVLDAIPQPSHLNTDTLANPFQRFDVLISMDVYEARQPTGRNMQSWSRADVQTYVVLPEDGSLTAEQFAAAMPDFIARHAPLAVSKLELVPMPLSSIALSYFDSGLRFLRTGVGSATMLYLLGGLVLLIACLNYSNLALAQSVTRTKEIGLRRVVGATRPQIIAQYLFEAALAASLATVLALVLLSLLLLTLPAMDRALDAARYFRTDVLLSWQLWAILLFTLCAVALVAGSYPAFVLSNVRPIQAVRAGQEKSSRLRIAALIVGAQFVSASFLLICILVMQAQSDFIRDASLATLHDPLLVVANVSDTPVKYETLRAELLGQPHVKHVTAAAAPPWELHNMSGETMISLSADPQATRRAVLRNVDNLDFFATLDFKLLAGRALGNEHASDDATMASKTPGAVANVVVDYEFVRERGWSVKETVGKTIYGWNRRDDQYVSRPLTIVGVVETKPLSIIEMEAKSNIFFLDSTASRSIIVRLSKDDVQAGLREVDVAWNRVAPNVAIQRSFADQALDNSLWMIDVITRVFRIITIMALIIAVLGLLGVSVHATHRRTHEIGVRKTLGADSRSILTMLFRDFSKPVLIANLIAWPIAYVLMRAYLSIFTQGAGLSLTPFLTCLALTLLVAWAAVSAQVIRAARLNPATVLRYE
jgi:putative ABC transport system permease protein